MKVRTLAISVALLVASSASLASDPPTAPTTPAAPNASAAVPAASASSPTAPTTAAATPPAAPNAAPSGQAAPGNDPAATAKAAHALGYMPKSRNGKLVYCKPEAALGTRLQHMSCFSEEEITAVIQRSVQNQDSLAKTQRTELYQEGKF